MAKVLLVDDDIAFVEATTKLLTLLDHDVDSATSIEQAREQLEEETYDRVFLDLMLPDGSGFHLLEYIPSDRGDTKVTIITGHPSVKNHVMSVYGMNVNYLIKPIELEQLQRLFDDTGADASLTSEKHFGELIGESDNMQALYEMVERVSSTDANVLLVGESGVGKEVVARAIHNASRVSGDLVAANCGAISSELIGSELFGHEKGAFTGAISRKAGFFEQAEGGTLFLDEITEMPLAQQPNLLRVLETKTVTRLGSTSSVAIKCRVISATNRTEEQIVQQQCLREDLYYRLAVFPIFIPPLRDRAEDIPLLAEYFLATLNRENGTNIGIKETDLQKLMGYDWPGNIRELRHSIHRAYIMSKPEDAALTLPDTFSSPFSRNGEKPKPADMVGQRIEDVEKQLILDTLKKYNQNKTKAAEVLGVSVKTLYNRLSSYGEEYEE